MSASFISGKQQWQELPFSLYVCDDCPSFVHSTVGKYILWPGLFISELASFSRG